MCFLEFIGYTCGHISLPVLRPCPLTTASHTFPTCPRRGDKPFLAGEMCPTCQKILHSRATQIEEYEHRFMHERGVCGCETIFPYLIRPRIIGGGDLAAAADGDGSRQDAAAAAAGAHGDAGRKMAHVSDLCIRNTPAAAAGDEAPIPPLLCEAVDAGGRSVVSVRLPSLYAAEWVVDHGKRHATGLCSCRVDFQTYNQATRADADAAPGEASKAQHLAPPVAPTRRRVMSLSSMPPDDAAELRAAVRKHQRSSSHEILSAGSGVCTAWADAPAPTPLAAHYEKRPTTGYLAQPLRGGRPVRYSGAVFTKVPGYLPLTGPFLARPTPFSRGNNQMPVLDGVLDADTRQATPSGGSGSGSATQHAPDPRAAAETMQHHTGQALNRTPLLGYPIGAGPEGVPHAAPWQGQPPCWKQN